MCFPTPPLSCLPLLSPPPTRSPLSSLNSLLHHLSHVTPPFRSPPSPLPMEGQTRWQDIALYANRARFMAPESWHHVRGFVFRAVKQKVLFLELLKQLDAPWYLTLQTRARICELGLLNSIRKFFSSIHRLRAISCQLVQESHRLA